MGKHNKKQKLIAALLLVAFLLTGCLGGKKADDGFKAPTIVNEAPSTMDYDLIVMGGEPEGVAAAIAGARNGLKTLLLCEESDLGGLYTIGRLNFIDIPETRSGQVLVEGVYKEFVDAVGGSGFDIEHAKDVFYQMVKKEDNITLRVNSEFKAPIMDDKSISGVRVQEGNKNYDFRGKYVIDATPDGDVAAEAGASYTFAGEDIGEKDRHMGVTLVFSLKDVDWTKVVAHLTTKRAGGEISSGDTSMGASGDIAWGYTREGYAYETKDDAMRLRGFNMARQSNGDVLINALIIFDVDPLDDESKKAGIERGKKELEHIVPYVQKNFKGFEKASLADTAEMLYVRESRHIDCEYMLTIDDVLENRGQWDKIAVSNYPVDVQPTKEQTYGTVVGFPDQYAISYRSLIPKDIDNLFVVGRAAGYRSLAAGSARIVPTGMACAEGAGVAAAVAYDKEMTPRDLCNNKELMERVQSLLTEQGANLNHTQTPEAVMSHWAYDSLKILRGLGLVDGGYDNNYRLDEAITANRYQNMVNNVFRKAGFPLKDKITVNDNPPNRQIIGTLARAIAEVEGDKLADNQEGYKTYLRERGILTTELDSYFQDGEKNPNQAEVMVLCAQAYQHLLTQPSAIHVTAIS